MPIAENKGQIIFYEDSGGAGPVLIFSHGVLMDRTMFASQVAAFQHQFRCITWDGRGHSETAANGRWIERRPELARRLLRALTPVMKRQAGRSVPVQKPGGVPAATCEKRGLVEKVLNKMLLLPFTYYDAAEDCIAVMNHAGVHQAVLVGMSAGGYLSLRCALRHPERVQALVLIGTQAALEDPELTKEREPMFFEWVTRGLMPSTLSEVQRNLLGDNIPASAAWTKKWTAMHPIDLVVNFITLNTRDDISEAVAAIQCPALVIHGAEDRAVPLPRAAAMHARLPKTPPMVVVPEAGHAVNLTHPAPVNKAIARFLERVTGTTSDLQTTPQEALA